ncbi:hypothetical protein FRAHR75_1060014 [Frankia sp. Hr75.2]|nr:hypothetical protein FRAHR75_1060014 [Frankia sp. Hr75.2]
MTGLSVGIVVAVTRRTGTHQEGAEWIRLTGALHSSRGRCEGAGPPRHAVPPEVSAFCSTTLRQPTAPRPPLARSTSASRS